MTDPKCPECAGKIQLGIAIRSEEEYGARYCFFNPPPITHKTMKIIPVYKCMSCGYSCDDDRDLLWKND